MSGGAVSRGAVLDRNPLAVNRPGEVSRIASGGPSPRPAGAARPSGSRRAPPGGGGPPRPRVGGRTFVPHGGRVERAERGRDVRDAREHAA
jgi:hypothetical protein